MIQLGLCVNNTDFCDTLEFLGEGQMMLEKYKKVH